MDYREILIHWRQKLSLTQTELAERIGIHKSVLSRIKKGERGLDITLAERWGRELGLELLFVAGEHRQLLTLLAGMQPDDLALLRDVILTVPRLNQSDRRTLWGLLDVWQRSSPSTEERDEGVRSTG